MILSLYKAAPPLCSTSDAAAPSVIALRVKKARPLEAILVYEEHAVALPEINGLLAPLASHHWHRSGHLHLELQTGVVRLILYIGGKSLSMVGVGASNKGSALAGSLGGALSIVSWRVEGTDSSRGGPKTTGGP